MTRAPALHALHLRLRAADHEPVQRRLAELLGPEVTITCGGEAPRAGSGLLFSPHEYAPAERSAILRGHAWSWVHLSTAGYDFVPLADVPAGAWLTRSWRAYAAPLAEYVLWALLGHAREVQGSGLRGQLVGVVGYGEVGRRIVALLALMEARVLVLTRSGPPQGEEPRRGVVTHVRQLSELEGVQQLVLAAALNDSSAGLVGRPFLERCARGLHLVNIARGELVDQPALLEAVRDRALWATLDVTVPEPLPAEHPLRREARVRITDHVAWRSGDELLYLEDFLHVRRAFARADEPPGLLRRPAAAAARRGEGVCTHDEG